MADVPAVKAVIVAAKTAGAVAKAANPAAHRERKEAEELARYARRVQFHPMAAMLQPSAL